LKLSRCCLSRSCHDPAAWGDRAETAILGVMPRDYRITRVLQTAEFTPEGETRQVYRVDFMVGSHGPFSQTFPVDRFDSITVEAQLGQLARTLQAVTRQD